ncbi:hypothetical protein CH372_19595 [Leptospira meyeri]|nr:hypothetical protein CH372_19595 [Leptospira meyeri]
MLLAIHESGHALLAHYFGRRPSIDLTANDDILGTTWIGVELKDLVSTKSSIDEINEVVANEIAMIIGGYCSERIIGNRDNPIGASNDEAKMNDLVIGLQEIFFPDDPAQQKIWRDMILNRARNLALELISKHRSIVLKLAIEADKKIKLSVDEVATLLGMLN